MGGSPSGFLLFVLVLLFSHHRLWRVLLVRGEGRDRLPNCVGLRRMRRLEGGIVSHEWRPCSWLLPGWDDDVLSVSLQIGAEVASGLNFLGKGLFLALLLVLLQLLLRQLFLVVIRVWFVWNNTTKGGSLSDLSFLGRVGQEIHWLNLHLVVSVSVILLDNVEVGLVLKVGLDSNVRILGWAEGLVVAGLFMTVLLLFSHLELARLDVGVFRYSTTYLERCSLAWRT